MSRFDSASIAARWVALAAAIALGAVCFGLVGCGSGAEERRGGVGEVCLQDTDCRRNLVCQSRVCAPLDLASNNGTNSVNNTVNNAVNNAVNNVSGYYDCVDLCEYLVECFDNDMMPLDDCVEGCNLEFDTEEEIDEVAQCFFTLTCDEVMSRPEICISGGF